MLEPTSTPVFGPKIRAFWGKTWLHLPMNIQVAVLCDAATDDHGKLNLLGAFDTIYAQSLPAVHPQCAIALRVTFTSGDEGAHQMKLHFVDADGRPIMPSMDIPVEVAMPEDSHFGTRNFIINIQQLKFAAPGLYAIDVTLAEQTIASVPLMVRLVQPHADESEKWKQAE